MAEEQFKVTDDKKADWALREIKGIMEEYERVDQIAVDRIAELNDKRKRLKEKYESDVSFLKGLLNEYFMTVKHKETKTQESYDLLSGKLVMKKASQKITHDDAKLLEYLDQFEDAVDYIKVERSVKWAEFKKDLAIVDGKVVDSETGEIVEGCSVEDVAPSFDVKF